MLYASPIFQAPGTKMVGFRVRYVLLAYAEPPHCPLFRDLAGSRIETATDAYLLQFYSAGALF